MSPLGIASDGLLANATSLTIASRGYLGHLEGGLGGAVWIRNQAEMARLHKEDEEIAAMVASIVMSGILR